MKQKLLWMTALGLLLPVTLLPQISAGRSAADFQRLDWLCSDYQMAVKGYVVEGWFQVAHVPGMERFLKERLQIVSGRHQTALADGSILSTSMQHKNGQWQIALQLVSTQREQVAQYYSRWQQFADRYAPNTPVGITTIAELAETMDLHTSGQLMRELAGGLALQNVSEITTDRYVQLSGYTSQLLHKLCINGTDINSSITVVPQEACTYLYIASPVLYQQI